MKKIISLAVMLLMIITMLTGCMNTVPTASENSAVAFVNVKVGVEQISLAVDKSEKVIVAAYGKYNDKNEYVSTDKKDTLFKDIDVAGKELNKALEDITALKLLSSSTEFSFDVIIKKSSITETDATKAAVEKIKTNVKAAIEQSGSGKVTFENGDKKDVLFDSEAVNDTSSVLE